jgi:hypothetical protein
MQAPRALYVEEELWKPRENEIQPEWNGYRNFWSVTDARDGTHLRQSAGINPVARVRSGPGRDRNPAIAIFIKPEGDRHSLPWLDEVDLDSGFIRYFGDNRPEKHKRPEETEGNRELLRQLDLYASDSVEDRQRAAPILFFRNLGSGEGTPFTQFLGFGLIRSAHRLTQIHRGRTFANYAYDCVLFRGSEDARGSELLDLNWIDARRDPDISHAMAATNAPSSWRRWIHDGALSIDDRSVRRYVDRAHRASKGDQLPDEGSPLAGTLQVVYHRFDGNAKHGFQALAALAAEHYLAPAGTAYHRGWVTPVGPDGGVDFVQRIDLGVGMSRVPLVILGQAKCKDPWNSGIRAEELARVVARLRRGWIGAFVTTSYYTDSAQRELVVDEYPVALLSGLHVARAVEALRDANGLPSVEALLGWVEEEYVNMLRRSLPRPSDILREQFGQPVSIGSSDASETSG